MFLSARLGMLNQPLESDIWKIRQNFCETCFAREKEENKLDADGF